MTWDKGWNFRATSGFVADGANCTYILDESYPTTRNTTTFGISNGAVGDSLQVGDDTLSYDTRLAGIHYEAGGSKNAPTYRFDLPGSGLSFALSLAWGQALTGGTTQTAQRLRFYDSDGTTLVLDLNWTGSINDTSILDANSATLSASAWPASNTSRTIAFSGDHFFLKIGVDGTDESGFISHMFLSQQASPPSPIGIQATRGLPKVGPRDAKGFLIARTWDMNTVPYVLPVPRAALLLQVLEDF